MSFLCIASEAGRESKILSGLTHIAALLDQSVKKIQHSHVIRSEKGLAQKRHGLLPVEKALDCYGNAILRLAYSYVHNMSDAEDILQDTLMKYMRSAPPFLNKEHEKAWLLRVAANQSKNMIQYQKIRETDTLEESLIKNEKEDLAFVWDAVKQLPEKYREVIHLYYQEGYQTKEISRILGRKESSVRSDMKRGREKLREILKEVYDFG